MEQGGEVMGREIKDVQHQHHLALLKLRCQDRIVESDDFIIAWERADDKQKRACHRLLRKLEVNELKEWVSKLVDEYSVATLRRLASNCNIKNYCNMTKEQLSKTLKEKGVISGKSKNSTGTDAIVSNSCRDSEKSNSSS